MREGGEWRRQRRHYCYSWLCVRWVWFILLCEKDSGKLLKAEQKSINIDFDYFLSGPVTKKKGTHSLFWSQGEYEEKELSA